jgi:hypothetical protein
MQISCPLVSKSYATHRGRRRQSENKSFVLRSSSCHKPCPNQSYMLDGSFLSLLKDHPSQRHSRSPPSSPVTARSSALHPASRSKGILTSRTRKMAISPRSTNYERLEGGMGPIRIKSRFPWKRFAIGAAVIISLVWFFGPREPERLPWSSKKSPRSYHDHRP